MLIAILKSQSGGLELWKIPGAITTAEAAEQWLFNQGHFRCKADVELATALTLYQVETTHEVDIPVALERCVAKAATDREAEQRRQQAELLDLLGEQVARS
jgi:hypothetical protein